MKISVILCTYNRSASLQRALESASALRLPGSVDWETVVVDNNSSDRTREVAEAFCRRDPAHFRYLFEPKQGKSNALNAGIRQTVGDILAFMDDDVIVEPTWLQNLTASLQGDGWAGAGGRILPQRAFHPPRWLSFSARHGRDPFALFDLGPEAGTLNEAPYGTNMAFRRGMFEKYGMFRTDLGPCPGSEIRGEDSDFANRLLAVGEPLRYEPSAVVYHEIPEWRVKKRYLLRWWFDKARSEIRRNGIPREIKLRIWGIPATFFLRLPAWSFRWLLATTPSRRFYCRIQLWIVAGYIRESHFQSSIERGNKLRGEDLHPAFKVKPKP